MLENAYHVSDVIGEKFLRLPTALFAGADYRNTSLEAKNIYALLLDRLSLSRKNGWLNEDGEVYVYYNRDDIAEYLNISKRTVIKAFAELTEVNLVCEKRQGLGRPNMIFVLKPRLSDGDATEYDERTEREIEQYAGIDGEPDGGGDAESEPGTLDSSQKCKNCTSRSAESALQEVQDLHFKKCRICTSYKGINQTENNYTEMSQSVSQYSDNINSARARESGDGQTDGRDTGLQKILGKCELGSFDPQTADMFAGAVEQLYFSDRVKTGGAVLPRETVKKYLSRLNGKVMLSVYDRLHTAKRVVNKQAYLISTIINTVREGGAAGTPAKNRSSPGNADIYDRYGDSLMMDSV